MKMPLVADLKLVPFGTAVGGGPSKCLDFTTVITQLQLKRFGGSEPATVFVC